ncbi:MAG: 16S rRNA (uracil(1498)-N(3))-methyltransferase [Desulfobacteraceae bacterium]|nr:16S rRNA (uracil(1498)-N(3))-methyltransferase [Desulfobacteraceae bacterium]
MNLILLKEEDFTSPGRVKVSGRRFTHIQTVHRAAVGDQLVAGLINDKMGTATVTHIGTTSIEMDVVLDQAPPPGLDLTLLIALPRPKMLKRILQTVTSLGVKRIYLINTWRVEKGFWSSPVLEQETLERHITLGLEQAKDTVMPQVFLRRLFSPFVKEELETVSRDTLKLVAHPKGGVPCPCHPGQPVTLAMGPEGGFIDREVETFERFGFENVSLGERILRLETAVPVLISRLFT